ncbi:ParB/RepB/Spo0J family partition protein [Thermanaeromonas sp. C210]|uniref:ParB/RepB/Spo0J family partition protein n=1 Tax=Thermanaeromonas sp. C210 TaxID=2731925 RepID=UPI00155BDC46|nr:ParB/RepB/Spo0J family partition protein [Thermanaeromonas sp. C210]GFN23101.1 chromosome partitioning protein ParB [Thermanaeromonas sp. C210]
MAKRGLGRGLSALLPERATDGGDIQHLSVDAIVAGRHQPRDDFDQEKLEELAASIRQHGVIQPVVVRPRGDGLYELVAGERRWRACRLAGIKEIPAVVRDLSEREMAEVALIENLQREDLNPLEEARAYQSLIVEHGLTQEEVAARVGKSRPVIANALRLLQLPLAVQEMLRRGEITAGHARGLLALEDEGSQVELATRIAQDRLSVRQVEELVKRFQGKGAKRKGASGSRAEGSPRGRDEDWSLTQIEEALEERLGTVVKVRQLPRGGRIEIYYYGEEELNRLVEELQGRGQG